MLESQFRLDHKNSKASLQSTEGAYQASTRHSKSCRRDKAPWWQTTPQEGAALHQKPKAEKDTLLTNTKTSSIKHILSPNSQFLPTDTTLSEQQFPLRRWLRRTSGRKELPALKNRVQWSPRKQSGHGSHSWCPKQCSASSSSLTTAQYSLASCSHLRHTWLTL